MTEEAHYLQCALITGASSGLGREYAIQLAPSSKHLVLVARREDKLKELQELLLSIHSFLKVSIYVTDLADKTERATLFEQLQTADISPTLLVNNAGLGDYGEFSSSDWNKVESMLEVNMTALTHLSHHFVPQMKKNKIGAILNVSSLASLLPIPDFAVYAATKAYVTSFGEALRSELAKDNIPVLTVCPGPIKTEFGDVAARSDEERFQSELYKHLNVPAEQVVRESLHALAQNNPRLFPGWKIALIAAGISLLPYFAIRAFNAGRFRKSTTTS